MKIQDLITWQQTGTRRMHTQTYYIYSSNGSSRNRLIKGITYIALGRRSFPGCRSRDGPWPGRSHESKSRLCGWSSPAIPLPAVGFGFGLWRWFQVAATGYVGFLEQKGEGRGRCLTYHSPCVTSRSLKSSPHWILYWNLKGRVPTQVEVTSMLLASWKSKIGFCLPDFDCLLSISGHYVGIATVLTQDYQFTEIGRVWPWGQFNQFHFINRMMRTYVLARVIIKWQPPRTIMIS